MVAVVTSGGDAVRPLPDADVEGRLAASNNARTEACRAFLSSSFSLLPEAGLCPMAVFDWPLCRTWCISLNGLHGTARFTVFLKRTALTEEKRRPFLDPDTPCFLTPRTRKDKLLRAESVVGSVTTSESLVLYVFASCVSFAGLVELMWVRECEGKGEKG